MSTTDQTPGRLYRIGAHWYLDTALLQVIARRLMVEPMQGGYQILAPAGLLRCRPAAGPRLPGQSGELFRLQGESPGQDLSARMRKLAKAYGDDVLGGEWEEWPTGALTTAPQKAACGCTSCSHGIEPQKPTCGCTSCKAGGTCSCGTESHGHDATQPFLERLILSETLGTVRPRTQPGGAIALYPAQHAAPEWACGRYHECIGSILRFPDLAANEWIAAVEMGDGKLAIRWGVILDRQRTLMLGDILQLVARLADRTDRTGPLAPAAPSKHTPGSGAWEMALDLTRRNWPCQRCPYRLGSNLRCPTCRQWHLNEKVASSAVQVSVIAKALREQTELRATRPAVLQTIAKAIAASNASNPHEPLTDRFFTQLERDVLAAQQPLRLSPSENDAILEIAELLPFEKHIAVGAAAPREAA